MENNQDVTNKGKKFRLPPALFLLYPIALCIFAAFPGWGEGRFAIVSYDGNGPVEAGSMSLFDEFIVVGGLCQILFYLGLALAMSVGVYGVIAAFVPKLRTVKAFFVPVLCALTLGMAASAWGHVLLGFRVEAITTDYFLSIDQVVTKSHALTRTTLTFIVSGLLPVFLWIWWLWAFILTLRSAVKAKKALPQP